MFFASLYCLVRGVHLLYEVQQYRDVGTGVNFQKFELLQRGQHVLHFAAYLSVLAVRFRFVEPSGSNTDRHEKPRERNKGSVNAPPAYQYVLCQPRLSLCAWRSNSLAMREYARLLSLPCLRLIF